MQVLLTAFIALAFMSSAFGAEPKRDVFGYVPGITRPQLEAQLKANNENCSPNTAYALKCLRGENLILYFQFTMFQKPQKLKWIAADFESEGDLITVREDIEKQFGLIGRQKSLVEKYMNESAWKIDDFTISLTHFEKRFRLLLTSTSTFEADEKAGDDQRRLNAKVPKF